jgi:Ribosomal protein L7/L12 C-terminal domain
MTEQTAFLAVLLLCVIVVVGLLGVRLNKIELRIARLSSVEAKLDLLLNLAGLEYDPYQNVPGEVADAIRSGKKIEAIKRYREATAVGLKEAKDFVEEVQRRGGVG